MPNLHKCCVAQALRRFRSLMNGSTRRSGHPTCGPRGSATAVSLALCLAVVSSGYHAPAMARPLKEVVTAALANHPQVLSADAAVRAARRDVDQARGGYLPSVDLKLGGGRENTENPQLRALGMNSVALTRRESGVTVSQKLFDGFATRSEVERQHARVGVADARALYTREAVALQAVAAYIEILKNRQLAKLARDNIEAHEQTLNKIQQRVRGGVGQRVDLQQAEGRVALARSVLTARDGRLREAEANYRRVVGEPPQQDLAEPQLEAPALLRAGAIDSSLLMQSIRAATEIAWSRNPAVTAADAEVEVVGAAKRGAHASFYPRFDLELSANRNNNL